MVTGSLTEIAEGLALSPVAPYVLRVRAACRLGNARYLRETATGEYWDSVAGQYVTPLARPVYFAEADCVWIRRELRRQQQRPVPPLPDGIEDRYPEHCVYLSAVDGMIGYTADYLKGRADIQTRIKPGRYLAKYYPEIPAHRAADWAHACAPRELTIATDADTWADVYFHGPGSCQHPESPHQNEYTVDWANHPVRMYAGPDLAIAYLGDKRAAIARAVVWPERKLYGRVYGELSLAERLEALGYRLGDMEGARCVVRRDGARIIVPYVDGVSAAEIVTDGEGREWLRLGHGPINVQNTAGYSLEEEPNYCSREGCDNECDEGDAYCTSCDDERWTCEECQEEYWEDDCRYGEHGAYCEGCWEGLQTCCEGCEESFVEIDLSYTLRQTRRRQTWQQAYCPSCAGDRYQCTECADVVSAGESCCNDEADPPETPDDGETPTPRLILPSGK